MSTAQPNNSLKISFTSLRIERQDEDDVEDDAAVVRWL
jgi:hypothetical protein